MATSKCMQDIQWRSHVAVPSTYLLVQWLSGASCAPNSTINHTNRTDDFCDVAFFRWGSGAKTQRALTFTFFFDVTWRMSWHREWYSWPGWSFCWYFYWASARCASHVSECESNTNPKFFQLHIGKPVTFAAEVADDWIYAGYCVFVMVLRAFPDVSRVDQCFSYL